MQNQEVEKKMMSIVADDGSIEELEALAGGATRIMQGLEEGREY